MSMTAHPVWFKDDSGKWSQINGVTDWVIATPLVGRGTYRDKPPPIPGAAGAALSADGLASVSMQVIGGVAPTVTPSATGGLTETHVTASADSTLAEDDDFTHEPLRYVFGPEPMIFFKTSVTGSPALPDATTYDTDRPAVPSLGDLTSGGKFPIITGDCAFPWTKNCGVTNTPPQGWTVFTGA